MENFFDGQVNATYCRSMAMSLEILALFLLSGANFGLILWALTRTRGVSKGYVRAAVMRLDELEGHVETLSGRVTRAQKQVAANASNSRTEADVRAEAEQMMANRVQRHPRAV